MVAFFLKNALYYACVLSERVRLENVGSLEDDTLDFGKSAYVAIGVANTVDA